MSKPNTICPTYSGFCFQIKILGVASKPNTYPPALTFISLHWTFRHCRYWMFVYIIYIICLCAGYSGCKQCFGYFWYMKLNWFQLKHFKQYNQDISNKLEDRRQLINQITGHPHGLNAHCELPSWTSNYGNAAARTLELELKKQNQFVKKLADEDEW